MREQSPDSRRRSRRFRWGGLGFAAGGLAPLVTGLVGVWSYWSKGYVVAKTGEVLEGPGSVVLSAFFVLAGLTMIGVGLRWFVRPPADDQK